MNCEGKIILFVWTDWRLSRLSHLKNLDSYKYIDHDIENFTASVINIKYWRHYSPSRRIRTQSLTLLDLQLHSQADDSTMQFVFVKFLFFVPNILSVSWN